MFVRTSVVTDACIRPLRAAVLVLTALVIGASSAALPAAAQTSDSPASLQTLVNDLGLQIELRYRANLPEYQRRYDQLSQAVAAWNASARSASGRDEMATWLRGAIRSSMPGSDAVLPAVPRFDRPDVAADTAPSPVGAVRNKPVVPDEVKSIKPSPLPEMPPAQSAHQPAPESAQPQAAPSPATQQPLADGPAAGQTPAKAPADQPAADETPAATQPVSPAGDETDAADDDQDFWLDHPAASDLPADLELGDPFRDDPLPAASSSQESPPQSP